MCQVFKTVGMPIFPFPLSKARVHINRLRRRGQSKRRFSIVFGICKYIFLYKYVPHNIRNGFLCFTGWAYEDR